MKIVVLFLSLLLLLIFSCRQKKVNSSEDFIPVLPFILNDVADVDTGLYPIRNIISVGAEQPDTFFVRREEFRGLAKEFLSLPDLTQKEYKKRFTEEKFYDRTLHAVVITYRPKYPENEDIQRQEILITPGINGDKVKSLFIDRLINNPDSMVRKRMLWRVGQSFQVTTLVQLPEDPERMFTQKVIWNSDENY